ncbi:MAG: hypothetical protein K2J90_14880, partial [Lachnospiraceae bacterium]|nr:hypothetical protein [Lachnospiraceae bacterium]
MNEYNAKQDIKFIREVLNKTQLDISGIGMCFVWIGIINLFGEVLKNVGYVLMNAQKHVSGFQWKMLRSVDSISFIII